jgi:ribosomal protein RSM22 (predicted rRNA methylase)
MSFPMPPALAAAVDFRLAEISANELARVGAALSARYRSPAVRGAPTARSRAQALAYAAFRLPATYAALAFAMAELRRRRPSWAPRTLLDLGAGPGAGLWAATTLWPALERATALDAAPAMLALGCELAGVAAHPAVAGATWLLGDVLDPLPPGRHDLVLLSYTLTELDPAAIEPLAERAWAATAGTLLVVEPGTPAGHNRALRVRDHLIACGAFVTAPCPHDGACPLAGGPDWCHFAARLPRSRAHRLLKGGTLGYEDEKLAYAALSREPTARATTRVLRHPRVAPGRIELELCTASGLTKTTVTRRDKAAFRRARKSAWGDEFS